LNYKVMQIEASNLCSLTCVYCPHPTQKRPKGDMSMAVFEKCMELVRRSSNPERAGRKFVWLNHFGEPLLNPLLPDFISRATALGIEVSFSTNAVSHDKQPFSQDLWRRLANAGLKGVIISTHARSERRLREHLGGIVEIFGVWSPAHDMMHDWAGQVAPANFEMRAIPPPASRPCDYETENMFAVSWDGRIAACCYDIEAVTGFTVDDVLASGFRFERIGLCSGCTLGRGDVSCLEAPGSVRAANGGLNRLYSDFMLRLAGWRRRGIGWRTGFSLPGRSTATSRDSLRGNGSRRP